MVRNIGLWIDHKQTYLIWSDSKNVEVIPSKVQPRERFTGGVRIGGRYNQNLDSELRHNAHYENQLSKYYERVISTIRTADSILVIGPGEAKREFEKALRKNKRLHKKLIKVETTDKMTKSQMVAFVRRFFSEERHTQN